MILPQNDPLSGKIGNTFCSDGVNVATLNTEGWMVVDINLVLGFWLTAFLLISAPGADWAFVLSSSMRGNSVFTTVSGLVAGYTLITLLVAAGLGTLVTRSPVVLTSITLIGGCYLAWLGILTLRHPAQPLTENARGDVGTNRSRFFEGIGVSGLNPKGLLVFLAILPQFTRSGSSIPVPIQMILLGIVFIVTCIAVYVSLGTFAEKVLSSRPSAARLLSRISGLGMLTIGGLLVLERIVGLLQHK